MNAGSNDCHTITTNWISAYVLPSDGTHPTVHKYEHTWMHEIFLIGNYCYEQAVTTYMNPLSLGVQRRLHGLQGSPPQSTMIATFPLYPVNGWITEPEGGPGGTIRGQHPITGQVEQVAAWKTANHVKLHYILSIAHSHAQYSLVSLMNLRYTSNPSPTASFSETTAELLELFCAVVAHVCVAQRASTKTVAAASFIVISGCTNFAVELDDFLHSRAGSPQDHPILYQRTARTHAYARMQETPQWRRHAESDKNYAYMYMQRNSECKVKIVHTHYH